VTKNQKPAKPGVAAFPPEFFERAERERQLIAAGQPLPPLVLPGTPFLATLTATMEGEDAPRAQLRETPPRPSGPDPSWGRIDLSPYLDGTHVPQVPTLLARTDGACLLYRGRVHSFHGESESGKSWVALAAAVEVLGSLNAYSVLMLDYESDAATVVGRLRALGMSSQTIRASFDYRRPSAPPTASEEADAWRDLMNGSYDLIILDGVTEALATVGVKSVDNDEVTRWLRTIPRALAARSGAAVVLVDHVTKDSDGRGRFAMGAQAKMAGLDGAAYVVDVIDPIGVGMCGRIALRVAKDRPGGVRPHAGKWRKSDRTQEAAVLVLDSREPGRTVATVEPPRADDGGQQGGSEGASSGWRPTYLMEKVSLFLEKANAGTSRAGIERAVEGRANRIRQAIDCLITDGYAAADTKLIGGHPGIRSVKPFRQALEFSPHAARPTSSQLVPDEVQISFPTSSPRPVSTDGTRDEVDLVREDEQ
jgi:hypothetical protein